MNKDVDRVKLVYLAILRVVSIAYLGMHVEIGLSETCWVLDSFINWHTVEKEHVSTRYRKPLLLGR